MPSCAASNSPCLKRSAPVNAPFSCPNSSLSKSVSVKAAQFTGMNGFRARGLLLWIARATSSFPVPVSPVIKTVALVGATRAIISRTARVAWAGSKDLRRAFQAIDGQLQQIVFAEKFRVLACAADRCPHHLRLKGFRDEVECTLPHALNSEFHRGEGGKKNHG